MASCVIFYKWSYNQVDLITKLKFNEVLQTEEWTGFVDEVVDCVEADIDEERSE